MDSLVCLPPRWRHWTFPALQKPPLGLCPVTDPHPKVMTVLTFSITRLAWFLNFYINGIIQYIFCVCYFCSTLSVWNLSILLSVVVVDLLLYGVYFIFLNRQFTFLFYCGWVVSCFFFINFYWRIVDLQCCITFYCTSQWISYTYTYIHSSLDFFPI